MFKRQARVWNHRERQFEYTDRADLSLDTVYSTDTGQVFHRSRNPVMDFTGLHDQTGHSVWVHDHLQSMKGRIYLVEADPKRGFVGVRRDGLFKKVIRPLDCLLLEGCLKIGHRYDRLMA